MIQAATSAPEPYVAGIHIYTNLLNLSLACEVGRQSVTYAQVLQAQVVGLGEETAAQAACVFITKLVTGQVATLVACAPRLQSILVDIEALGVRGCR